MTEEEAQTMLKALREHYNEPVMPVSRYCKKFRDWANVVTEPDLLGRPILTEADISRVQLAITKSNLLWRLIYLDEDIRKEKCPIHKGHWSGIPSLEGACPHGCQHTGWLPNKGNYDI
jgi:hypothetical protein